MLVASFRKSDCHRPSAAAMPASERHDGYTSMQIEGFPSYFLRKANEYFHGGPIGRLEGSRGEPDAIEVLPCAADLGEVSDAVKGDDLLGLEIAEAEAGARRIRPASGKDSEGVCDVSGVG